MSRVYRLFLVSDRGNYIGRPRWASSYRRYPRWLDRSSPSSYSCGLFPLSGLMSTVFRTSANSDTPSSLNSNPGQVRTRLTCLVRRNERTKKFLLSIFHLCLVFTVVGHFILENLCKMMSMLNQAAVEALCSATYLENYLDCMENLPDDLQRVVSQLRELDSQTHEVLKDIMSLKEFYVKQEDGAQKKRTLISIQRGLIRSQELGDEKLQLVAQILEHIENRTRQLEQDLENLDPGATVLPSSTPHREEEAHHKNVTSAPVVTKTNKSSATEERNIPVEANKLKRQRRQRNHNEISVKEDEKKEEDERPKKKKKRKAKKEKSGVGMTGGSGEKSPVDPPIDPDEPTYCLCERVSYGEMIGCDNDSCTIEWFHFDCIGLTNKPKGKWFCPNCRGDKPNVMRPDLVEQSKRAK